MEGVCAASLEGPLLQVLDTEGLTTELNVGPHSANPGALIQEKVSQLRHRGRQQVRREGCQEWFCRSMQMEGGGV